MAQIVKNQTKSLKDREYVKAARYMGVGTPTILRRHIIPNVASLLIIDAALGVVEKGWYNNDDAAREQPWLPNGPLPHVVTWTREGYTPSGIAFPNAAAVAGA